MGRRSVGRGARARAADTEGAFRRLPLFRPFSRRRSVLREPRPRASGASADGPRARFERQQAESGSRGARALPRASAARLQERGVGLSLTGRGVAPSDLGRNGRVLGRQRLRVVRRDLAIAWLSAATLFVALAPGVVSVTGSAQPVVVPSGPPTPTWTRDARSNIDSLIGWPPGDRVRAERRWEDQFVAYPSADNALDIEKHLSSVPHRAGSPADYRTAVFFRDRLKADGFDARFETFQVMFTGPVDQRLELVTPQARALDLLEGTPGNHTEYEKMAGPAFEANSGDGDVTGPLFYLNGGSEEDWKAFDDMHVTMPPGSIVIERFGAGSFSRDPRAGGRRGAPLVNNKSAR